MQARRFAQVFGAVYVLHLASAALGLYFGLAGRRTAASAA